jgi:hypothetical protein
MSLRCSARSSVQDVGGSTLNLCRPTPQPVTAVALVGSPDTGPRALMLGGGEQPVLDLRPFTRWSSTAIRVLVWMRCRMGSSSMVSAATVQSRRCARRGWCLRRVIRWLVRPSVVPRRLRTARCLLVSSGPLGRAQAEGVAEARREPSSLLGGLA